MSTRVVSKTINLEAAPEQIVKKYITRIDEHGIKIHPEDWQTNSNYLQLNGDGVYIKDSSQVELAKFTADGSKMGQEGQTYILQDYHSIQMVDAEDDIYFHISDLRNRNGVASLHGYADSNDDIFPYSIDGRIIDLTVTFTGKNDDEPTILSSSLITYDKTYKITEDTTVNPSKPYYKLFDGIYRLMRPKGTENPSANHWYETEDFIWSLKLNSAPQSSLKINCYIGGSYDLSNLVDGTRKIFPINEDWLEYIMNEDMEPRTEVDGEVLQCYAWSGEGSTDTVSYPGKGYCEVYSYIKTAGYYDFYYDTTEDTKAFTIGTRMSGSLIGNYSYSEGYKNQASSNYSHAEGYKTICDGQGPNHSEGNNTKAIGHAAHAEGMSSEARGSCTHVEGNTTIVKSSNSHAEGDHTTVEYSGYSSHAEGYYTKVWSPYSHAEGDHSIVSNNSTACHAEGYYTLAYGTASHSEGWHSHAEGHYSHAQNQHTYACARAQTTLGTYNEVDPYHNPYGTPSRTTHPSGQLGYDKYAVIVGNGTGDATADRSNALTVDWQGRVECGDYSGNFKSMFDIFYPVGSYYETSLSNAIPSGSQTPTAADIANLGVTWFDPNYAWGGTWVLEAEGKAHISAGSSYNAGTEYGANTKSYTPAGTNTAVTLTAAQSGVPAHKHTTASHGHGNTFSIADGGGSHAHKPSNVSRSFLVAETKGISINRSTIKNGTGTEYANVLRVGSASGYVNSTESVSISHGHTLNGSVSGSGQLTSDHNTTADATKSHNHTFTGTQASINVMQASIAVYRWHRTA